MIKMLEMLCAIPEEIGWVIVGAMGMITVQLFCKLMWEVVIEPIVCSIKKWWKNRQESKVDI
jgi:hypothetical protein